MVESLNEEENIDDVATGEQMGVEPRFIFKKKKKKKKKGRR